MAKPRHGRKPAPRKRKRRLGTILFLVGILAVLGGTFAAGALAGRLSFRPSASLASAKTTERVPKPAPPPPPELTFYRELIAPLTPPPPPPKPAARAATKREPIPETSAKVPAESAPGAPSPDGSVRAEPRAESGRYTVQVASYNARAQADSMQARLAAAGHEAYVAEGEAGGVMRYRVRIGAFGTAEEARQAAGRLASQEQVATFVTTR